MTASAPVDAALLGRWRSADGVEVSIESDDVDPLSLGIYRVRSSSTYTVDGDDRPLVLDGASFTRVGAWGGGVVGHWRDADGGEEVLFLADGRYLTFFDGEAVPSFGCYDSSGAKLDRLEVRARVRACDGRIVLVSSAGRWSEGTYAIDGDQLTLDLDTGTVVYHRY